MAEKAIDIYYRIQEKILNYRTTVVKSYSVKVN